jgi:hypothetical protein
MSETLKFGFVRMLPELQEQIVVFQRSLRTEKLVYVFYG